MSSSMLWILVVVFLIGIQVFTASLVYRDAREKKLLAEGWTAMNVFLPFIGILIYFVLNPLPKSPEKPGQTIYDKGTNPIIPKPSDTQKPTERQVDSGGTRIFVPFIDVEPTTIVELVIQNGPRQSQRHKVKDGKNTIGCSSGNSIVIETDDRTVSAEQAIIVKKGETCILHNLSTTNKTKVNGQAVDSRELKDEDTIQMGSVVLGFWNRKL